jgi:deoxyribonuclease-4
MRLGVHVRIAGGLLKSLERAQELSCEAVQLFSGNPNAWARKPLDLDVAASFAAKAASLDIHPIILHTPYLLNLASPDDVIWIKSREALADAVGRAPAMGASIIVIHIGSHRGEGYEAGVGRIAEAVRYALDAAPEPVIALEMGSGSGNSIGSRFEEMADIMRELGDAGDRVGVCLDTAHLWGAGYDISTAEGVGVVFDLLKKHVGFDKLKVIHLNDTEMALDSRRDRHFHIGKGQIGLEGFRAIINYPGTADLPGIIETPAGESLEADHQNLATLRSLRSG